MIRVIIISLFLCSTVMAGPAGTIRKSIKYKGGEISFIATPEETVRDMLWMARLKPDDVVYDLGSGDGRIVIAAARDFGVKRAVGIESDPALVERSREAAEAAGVSERVVFIEGDMFTSDFSEATVVTLFVGHGPNVALRPQIFHQLQPGDRVVSNQSGMGEWKPDALFTTYQARVGMWGTMMGLFDGIEEIPDYSQERYEYNTKGKIFSWTIPAGIAGEWLVTVQATQGERKVRLTLDQRLSDVSGTFRVSGEPEIHGRVECRVSGAQITWECIPAGLGYRAFNIRFEGNAESGTMSGTLKLIEGDHTWESDTVITRVNGTVIGTWPCSHPLDQRPMRLEVTEGDSGLSATLYDREDAIEISDFYDIGGGLYFTYLFGSDGWGVRITKDTGWLIGKAHIVDGQLRGELRFYKPTNWIVGDNDSNNREPVIVPWITSCAAVRDPSAEFLRNLTQRSTGPAGLRWLFDSNPKRTSAIPWR